METRDCIFSSLLVGGVILVVLGTPACSSETGDGRDAGSVGDPSGQDAGDDDARDSMAEGGSAVDGAPADLTALDGRAASDAGTRVDAGTQGDATAVDANGVDVTRADAGNFDASSGDTKVPPPGFWDPSGIPAAKNVMMFKFLNRTNGKYADSEVYWSFKSGAISETHSIAEQAMYDMPANSSGRMYFYICAAGDSACASDPTKSKYFDFIEHTIGAKQYNGNTTRVDAFGLKIAMRMHCADNFEATVGEDYETFLEDRAVTFQKFIDFVPAEFKPLAQPPHAPYRIVEPGAGGFNKGGAYEHYYDAFVDQLWAANGITIAKPGPNGSGLGSYPDLSAAIYRHVGAVAGAFDATGKLTDKRLWTNSATFYQTAPAHYYAAFWHLHAIDGKAYGFPYDDVGSYSTYISHSDPAYMMVAIGW